MRTFLPPALRYRLNPAWCILLLTIFLPVAAEPLNTLPEPIHCDYYMCQYEKGNIDAIILAHAIRFIDVGAHRKTGFHHRDREMFENLKKEIFDREPEAKVIVYIGANHIGEQPTLAGIYLTKGKRRPLGYFLDSYTAGRNFSVYMGYPYDTPEGCDLFIGDFIWNMVQKEMDPTLVSQPSINAPSIH